MPPPDGALHQTPLNADGPFAGIRLGLRHEDAISRPQAQSTAFAATNGFPEEGPDGLDICLATVEADETLTENALRIATNRLF